MGAESAVLDASKVDYLRVVPLIVAKSATVVIANCKRLCCNNRRSLQQ